jgi:stage II sporulation protein AB (anti-sigma F factor)
LKDNVLDIVIKDKGIGIEDLDKARKPMYTTGGADRSGMGFTIMESFMNDFSVISKPGNGTIVHMRRRLLRRK